MVTPQPQSADLPTSAAARLVPRFSLAHVRADGGPGGRLVLALLALAWAISPGADVAASTAVPGGTISTATSWTPAGSPYVVGGTVTIGSGGALTIAAGVQVRFAISAALDVASGGVLSAVGTAGAPISFISDAASPQKGDWYYLRAQSGARVSLNHCEIAHAGRGGNVALPVYSSDVTVRNCRIHDNASRAVHLEGAGLAPVIEDTRIENNGEIAIYQTTIDMTPIYRRLTMAGNGTDAIVIVGAQVNRAVTLDGSSTALSAGSLIVNGAVTVAAGSSVAITPGSTVKLGISSSLDVVATGQLSAVGTSTQPIVLTSSAATPQPGDWYYLRAQAGATVRLTHCVLAYAGRGGYPAAYFFSSDVILRNCTIRNNASRGIHLEGAGLSPIIEDTRVESNGEIALYQTTLDMTPTLRRLSFTGNATNSLVIPGGTVTRAVSLDGSTAALTAGTLAITGNTNIASGGALSVAPGTTLRMGVSTQIDIQSGGALDAVGTGVAPIAFASTQANDWYGIRAYSGSHLRLDHCDLAHAGRSGYAALLLYGADAVIAASRIHHNQGRGVQIEGAGLTPALSDTQIDHNGGEALFQNTINMAPTYTNLTLNDNSVDSLVIAANTVTGTVTLDGSAGRFNGRPIRLSSSLVVNNGAALTVAAGTTLRLPVSGAIDVNGGGSLVATGTESAPIVLTSTSVAPTPNEWYYLRANPGSHLDLAHCEITSAGRGNNAAVLLYTSDASLSHCRIHDNQWHGIYLEGAGLAPEIGDTRIDHNGGYALYQYTINMAPAYSNLTLDGNGTDALVIYGNTVTSAVTLEATAATIGGKPIIPLSSIVVDGGGSLTVKAGTTLKLPISGEISVNAQGTLNVAGSAAAPVLLTSSAATPARGDWYYLRAHANSSVSLAYCDISAAGRGNNSAILLYSSGVTISHCRIHDNQWHGIYLEGAGLAPVIGDTQIDHNGAYALYQYTINMAPAYSNLTLADNGTDALVIYNAYVTTAVTIAAPATTIGGKPIILLSSINVGTGASLVIGAGATIKLPVSAVIEVLDGGTLVAEGSDSAPIVFTSSAAAPVAGDWYYLRGQAGSHLRLSDCEITAAGRGNYAAVIIATTDAALSRCRIHGNQWDGLSATNEASPRLTNNHIYGNALGVRNTNAKSWVDARLTWWGDASGPYHPTLNPQGKGNAVSDRVLFVPWLEDEAGTILAKVFLQVVGPSRASPGETVDYAVSYYAGEAVDDAVLMLSLPSAAEFKQATAGGIYWPARHEVFWKLGDLAPGDEGTMALTVRFAWGMPNGIEDVAMALLGGRDLAPTVFDVSPYLDYVEETIVGVVPLSEGAIATERSSFAAVEALAAQAEADGFYLGGGARVSLSTGRELTLIDFIADAATATIVREGDLVLATTLSPGKARIATAGGGMEWQFTGGARELSGDWLDDTPGSLGVQASSAAKPITWGDCFTNCALTDKDMTYDMVARAQELGNSFLNTGECRKWLAKVKRGQRNLDGWLLCKPALESSLNVGGVISQTLMDCAVDCKIKDRFKHECRPGQSMARCDPNLTFNEWVFSKKGAVSKRNYWIWTCDPATKLWSKPTLKRCGTREVCKDGWRDTSGIPCASGSCLEEDPEGLTIEAHAACARLAADGLSCAVIPTTVRAARDPNAKHGAAGDVLPGQRLDYTVEFENEGSGTAYGVYIVDRLSEHLDDATLTVTGPGEYVPATREIYWTVGELAPKGETGSKGEVGLSVELKDGLPGGTVVSNQAVVYFPSVPEETPTNTVVNVVQPVTATPQSVATTYTTPVDVTLAGAEVSGLPLTFAVVERPANGELSGVPPALTYTPAEDFVGEDRFTFTAGNGTTTSRPAPVVITVASSAFDTEPPDVLWVSPAAGAEVDEVSLLAFDSVTGGFGPPLLVQLSEPIAPGSVDGAVTVLDGSGLARPIVAWFDATANRVVILLRERWQPTAYTVTVAPAVADLAGNHLAAPYTWSFTARPPGWVRERLWSVP